MDNYKKIIRKLEDKTYFSTPRNNALVLEFMNAKKNGGYGRITYKTQCSEVTRSKKIKVLNKIDSHFKKDFDKITEEDILGYKDLLNKDKIFCGKVNVTFKEGVYITKVSKTKRPLSYRFKKGLVQEFKEFHEFIREKHYQENSKKKAFKELPDITRFFIMVKPKNFSDYEVEFIPSEEISKFLKPINNQIFKSTVQASLMSGARPCEIINIIKGKHIYENEEGKWIIYLPRIKGVSYRKYPFVVDMYEEDLYPYFESIKDGELVFPITEQTFRKLMRYYSLRILKKAYSPKILRKTARMIRINAGFSSDWINKLLGHSPNSQVIKDYTNYSGIKDDPIARDKLKELQYPNLKENYDKITLELKAMREREKQTAEHMVSILNNLDWLNKRLENEKVRSVLQIKQEKRK